MTTRVSLQRCPKPVGVVFPTRVILRNGSPRLLLGEVQVCAQLDPLAFSVKWEVGTRLFHHIINSLEPQKVGENTSSAPLDRSLKPGADGGGDLCSAAASVEVGS